MTIPQRASSKEPDHKPDNHAQMLTDLIEGLTRRPKKLPPKYFYDERGSQIFDEITKLEEYYLTRTETALMKNCGAEIAGVLGPDVLLVEYGSGSSVKTRILLDHMENIAAYVPVDISGEHLLKTAESLRADYPGLTVLPVTADFTSDFELPEVSEAQRTVVYFPGSTIGNFEREEAQDILKGMAKVCGPHGGVLIGVDLDKDPEVLRTAYNDSKGVTAAFNLNMLERFNRELGTTFDSSKFEHRAVYNPSESRIEMNLVSKVDQSVRVDGLTIPFSAGELIITEYSHKYTPGTFQELASTAHLATRCVWTDPDCYFSVQYLTHM